MAPPTRLALLLQQQAATAAEEWSAATAAAAAASAAAAAAAVTACTSGAADLSDGVNGHSGVIDALSHHQPRQVRTSAAGKTAPVVQGVLCTCGN